jgi:hypothetical protein
LLDLPRKMDTQQNSPLSTGEDRTLGGSRELFPEDFPLVGATTVVVSQAVQGSSLGDKVSRLGLEAMQSIDLASSKSAGLGSFLANEPQSGSSKGFESSSKTELPGMSDSFRPSAAGGQEGPRPIISAELLVHLSSATSLDQTANTLTAVSHESQDCCHYSLPSDPQVPFTYPWGRSRPIW